MDYKTRPGSDLIEGGIDDLTRGIESPQALLVAIGKPRLTRGGSNSSVDACTGRSGQLACNHYDSYAQALAKIERGHAQDLQDVRAMIARRLIDPQTIHRYFDEIEPFLYRYPAIHPPSFRQDMEAILSE